MTLEQLKVNLIDFINSEEFDTDLIGSFVEEYKLSRMVNHDINTVIRAACCSTFIEVSDIFNPRGITKARARGLVYDYLVNYKKLKLRDVKWVFHVSCHSTVHYALKALRVDLETNYQPTVKQYERFKAILNY